MQGVCIKIENPSSGEFKKLINNLYLELNDNYIQIMKINKISSINAIEEEIHKIKNKYKGQNLDPNKYSFHLVLT